MKKLLIPGRKAIAFMLGLFLLFFATGSNAAKIKPLDEENIKLNLSLVSDVHMEGNNFNRFKNLPKCFRNLKNSKDSIDALISLGDNTMNGQSFENLLFYGMLEVVNPIKPYYALTGNHDVGNLESKNPDYDKLRERQLDFINTFTDADTDELYYSKVINGYTLIFLGPDEGESDFRSFSDKQLNWLENEIDKAHESGNPVFIFNHHPVMYITKGVEKYEQIVTKYENIFVVIGHMHYYVRCETLHGKYDTPEIWVPCLSLFDENGNPNEETGLGFQLEVYENKVVFRGINYYTAEFTGNDYSFDLK